MKRFRIFLTLVLALLTLTACNQLTEPPEVTAFTDPAEKSPIVVTTVEQLLSAIAPGAEIILGEGEFHLDSAPDYGDRRGPYYIWNDLGMDTYELQIQYVDGLTIRGAGQGKTTLVTDSRWANVISIVDSQNVTLQDMTLGHTEMTEACEGGVIRLNCVDTVNLEGLGLYGCGTCGLYANDCQDVTMESCEVYDCSISGIQLGQCGRVTVNQSDFHSLGKEMPVLQVFGIWGSDEVLISDCMVNDNYIQNIAEIHGENVVLRNNCFSSNRIASAAFSFQSEGITLENNQFEGEPPRNWYTSDSFPGLDQNGEELLLEESRQDKEPVSPGTAVPVSTGEQKTVKVKNVNDFLNAIGPDTCIVLNTKLLDLSKSNSYKNALDYFEKNPESDTRYQEENAPYYCWVNNYDGPSLVITDVSNMTIQGKNDDRTESTISAVPRYADVLTFENCSAITLSGFTAGHTIEPGYCTGGVFLLKNSENILIDNCGMFGCGTDGVSGLLSRNIQIVNSEIYECSYCGIELSQCDNVAICGTIIRDIRNDWQGDAPFFSFYGSSNVTLDGATLDGNYVGS